VRAVGGRGAAGGQGQGRSPGGRPEVGRGGGMAEKSAPGAPPGTEPDRGTAARRGTPTRPGRRFLAGLFTVPPCLERPRRRRGPRSGALGPHPAGRRIPHARGEVGAGRRCRRRCGTWPPPHGAASRPMRRRTGTVRISWTPGLPPSDRGWGTRGRHGFGQATSGPSGAGLASSGTTPARLRVDHAGGSSAIWTWDRLWNLRGRVQRPGEKAEAPHAGRRRAPRVISAGPGGRAPGRARRSPGVDRQGDGPGSSPPRLRVRARAGRARTRARSGRGRGRGRTSSER